MHGTMEPIRPSPAPVGPRRAPAAPAAEPPASEPRSRAFEPSPELVAFRDYARARGLREDDFLEGVRTLLSDPAPSPPREDRARALRTLLEAFPPTPGRTLLGSPHREVLASIDEMRGPATSELQRKGMTTTGYLATHRPEETLVVEYRRPEALLTTYMQAVEDYVALARLVEGGLRREPGGLAEVRHAAAAAFQVEYQHLYREPVMTGLFREFLGEVGRSDHALQLARLARDLEPSRRQGIREAHAAVRERSGADAAWVATRLAMDCGRPGEELPWLARELDRGWVEGSNEAVRLNREFPGLGMPRIGPLLVAAAGSREGGASPVPVLFRILEGYFLTGSPQGMEPLVQAFDAAFPPERLEPVLRGKLLDQAVDSLKVRRRQGLDPETSMKRALEDVRLLLGAGTDTPGTIEEEGTQVRIGGISLQVRGNSRPEA